ncbi:MAG: NTP transferase domain-containing protein [Treponema sp.]|nr:NTP transferase domain-containing protein [Treponema sp.]
MSALVLQARLDSSRLPGKALLPLGGRPMIFRVMQALAAGPWNAKVLACPEDSVSAFAPLAEEAGFSLLAGPKEDVLARYTLAVDRFGPERIVRATGDNPFVFLDAAAAIDREAQAQGADYAAYEGLPTGAGVESVAAAALLRAGKEAKAQEEREHVCPYLYAHPEIFRLHIPPAPPQWQAPALRLTVDTAEDYEQALLLYEALLSLPPEERNLGENIIAAYRKLNGSNNTRL